MLHNYFYRFVRKRTKPITIDKAVLWKRRLSIAYGLLAWNAFGLVVYLSVNGKSDWAHYYGLKSDEEKALPPGYSWATTLGIQNAKVYRIAGATKVDEYSIVNGEMERKPKESPNSDA